MGRENLAKLLYAQLLLIVLVILFLPLTASAYFGSESSVYIIAKNMPSYQVCYLDILEYNSLWNESGRISELEDYFSIFPHFSDEHDRSAINILKNYNKDGWTPLSANPFGMGLNDIECDVKDGKCVKKFTFDRKIDKFKIIVVTSDGMTAVSNVIERKAFDSIVFFDYMSEEATELSIGLAFLILFVCTCLKALIVEGLVLLLFRFDMERDGVPFLAINIFTQAFLSLLLAAVLYSRGRVEAVLAYLLLELIILIAEVYLYANFLEQHSKLRRILFALTANILSIAAGIGLIIYHGELCRMFLQL